MNSGPCVVNDAQLTPAIVRAQVAYVCGRYHSETTESVGLGFMFERGGETANIVSRQMNEPPYGEAFSLWVEEVTGGQRGGGQAVFSQVVVAIHEAPQFFAVENTSWTAHGAGSSLVGTVPSHGRPRGPYQSVVMGMTRSRGSERPVNGCDPSTSIPKASTQA